MQHGLADSLVADVGLAFLLGALEAESSALGVGGAGDSVLHLAAEAGHAAGGLGRSSGAGAVGVVGVIFAAFGLVVGLAGDFQQVVLDFGALGSGEAVEVVQVVIGGARLNERGSALVLTKNW